MSEEIEIERACPFIDQIEEDREQRQDNDNGRKNGKTANQIIHRGAPTCVQAHRLRLKVDWAALIAEWLGTHISGPPPVRHASPPRPSNGQSH